MVGWIDDASIHAFVTSRAQSLRLLDHIIRGYDMDVLALIIGINIQLHCFLVDAGITYVLFWGLRFMVGLRRWVDDTSIYAFVTLRAQSFCLLDHIIWGYDMDVLALIIGIDIQLHCLLIITLIHLNVRPLVTLIINIFLTTKTTIT